MKNIVLSICITVFNQIELVRDNLDELIKYQKDDIEIIVSDDCSKDDIKSLTERYEDKRIKYYRTEKNAGHDLNIIYAIKHSSGKYVLLLRSRDKINSEYVSIVIQRLKENKESVYILFSAVDENKKEKMILSNKRYHRGHETIAASARLMRHPSGQIYNRAYLDLEQIQKHIQRNIKNKFGFQAHVLIRMQLAEKGDFLTFSDVGWVYSNTSKAKDVAQNSSSDGISVYAPCYEYSRYECEFKYVFENISNKYKYFLYKAVIKQYYRSIMVDFPVINSDTRMQYHYNCKPAEFSEKREWAVFKKKSKELFHLDAKYYSCLSIYLCCIRFMNLEFKIRSWVIRNFGKQAWFKRLYKLIKRIS